MCGSSAFRLGGVLSSVGDVAGNNRCGTLLARDNVAFVGVGRFSEDWVGDLAGGSDTARGSGMSNDGLGLESPPIPSSIARRFGSGGVIVLAIAMRSRMDVLGSSSSASFISMSK